MSAVIRGPESPDDARSLWRDLSGPVVTGLFDVIVGVAMLVSGVSTGWSLLVSGYGLALLVIAWIVASEVELDIRPATIVFAVVCVSFLVLAVIYFTHDADSIPRLIPGADAHSERWFLVRGALSLMIFVVMIPATCASAVPRNRAARVSS